MPEIARPWCCPDPQNCAPLIQLKDGDAMPLDEVQVGQTWTCFGRMKPTTFTYAGIEHPNDLHSCHYTALKGVVMYQENRADWESLATYYHLAVRKLDIVEASDD